MAPLRAHMPTLLVFILAGCTSQISTNLTQGAGTATTSATGTAVGLPTPVQSSTAVKAETSTASVPATPATVMLPMPGGMGVVSLSSATGTGLNLTWAAATDKGTPTANLLYRVFASTNNNVDSPSDALANGTPLTEYVAGSTTANVVGLIPASTYYVNVLVKNATGNIAAYTPIEVSTPALPGMFTIASATPGNAQVVLSWGPASLATTYVVRRGTATGGPYSTVLSTSAVSPYTDTTALNGTTYFYVVTAFGVGGSTNSANQVSATPIAPPPAPGALTAIACNACVNLSWNAANSANSYNVYFGTSSGVTVGTGTKISLGNVTSYTHANLTDGTTYFYLVTAVNASGEGVSSPAASATPAPPPLYISDSLNNRIRVVNRDATILTAAGGGAQNSMAPTQIGLSPNASALDSSGNLFIADQANGVVRVVAAVNGTILGIPVLAGLIYTVAGNGALGYGGDGGLATAATLNALTGVAVDSSGNLYIADYWNNRVRVVAQANGTVLGLAVTTGHIYTIAGTGANAYSGDGGTAASAALSAPTGIAVDSLGNLFIADQGNCRIRVVAQAAGAILGVTVAAGHIYTVAGTGALGSSGDAGAATSAKLFSPVAIAVDSTGNLYIADSGVYRVRVVAAAAGTVLGVAVAAGDIYTVAGNNSYGGSGNGGLATAAKLSTILSVAVDAAGNLYLADSANYAVRMVAAATGVVLGVAVTAGDIYAIAGNGTSGFSGDLGPATAAEVRLVSGVAVDGTGNLYVADTANNRLRVVAAATGALFGTSVMTGAVYTVAGNGSPASSGDSGNASFSGIGVSSSVAEDASGNLFIADTFNNRVRLVAGVTGTVLGIAVTAGDIYTVAGNSTPGFSGDTGVATSASLASPAGVALDSVGNLYIADENNLRIRVVAAVTGTTFGVAVTAGHIYTVAGSGTYGSSGDAGAATAAQFRAPVGVAVDGSGNLYVADYIDNRIRAVAAVTGTILGVAVTAGNIYTVAGNGTRAYSGDTGAATSAELAQPKGVAVDHSGNLYIADSENNRVRAVAAVTGSLFGVAIAGGHIDTVAGTGVGGYNGDAEAAFSAQLNGPTSVAVDSAGDLYIADRGNNRVRLVPNATGVILGISVTAADIFTVAGSGTAGFGGDAGGATLARLNYPVGVAVPAF